MNQDMHDSAVRALDGEELDLVSGALGERLAPAIVATVVQFMLKNGDMAPVKCNAD